MFNMRGAALVAAVVSALISQPVLADSKDPVIIMVSGPLFDPFFSALKKGADDAARDLGIEYQYSTVQDANNIQADLARILDQAIASGPDVIVAGNYFPDATSPMIKRATEQGLPIIIQDGGYVTWKDVGALTYVGYDPEKIGTQSGEIQAKAGVKNGLCVNHVPGNPSLESLCNAYVKSITDAGGKGKVLTIAMQDAQNPQANLQAIKGSLEADSSIDGIMTLGATQTTLAAQAAEEAGHEKGAIKIGGSGLSTAVLEGIRDGKVQFGVDLQAYLDGYYGILIAYHKVKYDLAPVEPTFVGPRFIFQDDAQKIIDVNKEYVGIRGTN
ncbi:sugar ABC transporter substrate-binding protein (plasmid) [Agrobacterium leguminum]|uniref:Periplasmic binding protein/LacI transcriptional regulator n=1 Tax=Agrobacterium deltaense NCPPB 1641 TaxID=1183425 RepID=A0A1S7UB35_9HYPH|nr:MULTISPECIES: sugar ABC transporter substrate-binding protein [Agrobacterium]WFS69788.1 sugar ABC transporter substrate-binding protein [Agrobacterium leguminum]CVI64130.1 putative Periplasmic binding protein/LacI transcriptional regulator [Agrobacterium deltaense NCPPB 1641]